MTSSHQTSKFRQSELNTYNNSSIIHLENLPNELFYILFNYFNINELYTSFSGLNSRLNNLLNFLSTYHLCLQATTKHDFVHIFASKITSIHVKADCISISLSSFRNSLYKLILDNLTEKSMQELFTLVHLKYLEIKSPPNDDLSSKLSQFLVSSSKLNDLVLPYWLSRAWNNSFFPSIYSLRLFNHFHANDFVDLLGHIPNLIHLYLYTPYVQLLPTIVDPLPNIHHCLSYFQLHLTNGFTDSQFDFYLAHVPNLKSFHFSTAPCLVYRSQRGPYDVLNCIARIVEKRLLNLQRFLCFIIFEIISNDAFDITKIHTVYNQNYSIKFGRNKQEFKFKWIQN